MYNKDVNNIIKEFTKAQRDNKYYYNLVEDINN